MVDGDQYISRLTSVMKQFQMAREAVSDLKDESRLAPVVKKKAREELQSLGKMFKKALKLCTPSEDPERQEAAGMAVDQNRVSQIVEEFEDRARKDFVSEVELACNRVDQNEVIMLVSLFEAQMKDIHREILRQEPTLLSPDRQVPLGRIISEGIDAILDLEIEREVQSLDRKNFEERAVYFQNRLGLDWPQEIPPKEVRDVLEIRNRLLHEDADLIITQKQLLEARGVALLPFYRICLQCAKRYPAAFSQWDGYAKMAAEAEELEQE